MLKIEKESENKVKIKIIGVGVVGNEIISLMTKQDLSYSLLCVDTDIKALDTCRYPHLLLGEKHCHGIGTDGNYQNGRTAAMEDFQEITNAVKGAELVIIVAGAGGGTGGAAPIIAKCARDQGIMTVGIAISPFKYEGDKRAYNARSCISELKNSVDAMFVIPSDNIFIDVDNPAKLLRAYKDCSELVKNTIMSMIEMLNEPGIIALDLQDVKTVLIGEAPKFIAFGEGAGEDALINANRQAVEMLRTQLRQGEDANVIISYEGDLSIVEINEAMELISNYLGVLIPPDHFEPPVRSLRATVPAWQSH